MRNKQIMQPIFVHTLIKYLYEGWKRDKRICSISMNRADKDLLNMPLYGMIVSFAGRGWINKLQEQKDDFYSIFD